MPVFSTYCVDCQSHLPDIVPYPAFFFTQQRSGNSGCNGFRTKQSLRILQRRSSPFRCHSYSNRFFPILLLWSRSQYPTGFAWSHLGLVTTLKQRTWDLLACMPILILITDELEPDCHNSVTASWLRMVPDANGLSARLTVGKGGSQAAESCWFTILHN